MRVQRSFGERGAIALALAVLLGVVVLTGALLWALWLLLAPLRASLLTLPATVAAPTAIGSLTALVSLYSVLVATHRRRSANIEREHRNQRIPVYAHFYETIFRFLMADNLGTDRPDEKDMAQFFVEFTQSVALWGSPELIRTWSQVMKIARESHDANEASIEMMLAWENLLFVMREDVGHSNKGMGPGDLLRMFVNDIDEHINQQPV